MNLPVTLLTLILSAYIVESDVLDPALYLVPSPPLLQASDSASPGEIWGRSLKQPQKIARDSGEVLKIEDTTSKPAVVEGRMFWPRFSAPEPVLGVHIPLTFSLSGSYGKGAAVPSVIGNTYTSVAGTGASATASLGSLGSNLGSLSSSLYGKAAVGTMYGNYGRSALAGSSYGSYGGAVRVYGGDNVAAWSGWGNGKWGHYGKG